MHKFYVYIYYDTRHGKKLRPIYVGKGTIGTNRHMSHWNMFLRGKRHYNRIFYGTMRKIYAEGLRPKISIVARFTTESVAFSYERYLISLYGRRDCETGYLCNMSEGGEGPSGQIISEETRRRLSISHKGIVNRVGFKQPEYVKQKISETLSGRKLSKETCRRMSISRTGSKHPMFGKKHSEESRRKNAEAHKKLTEREVNTIRKMYESGKYRQWELADMFGVCQMTISHVTRRSLYLYA